MNQAMDQIRSAREAVIDHFLAAGPESVIPAGFAAKVIAALPAAPVPRRSPQLASKAALVAAVALLFAMFLLAPHVAPRFTSSAFDLELLLLAQLAVITLWLALWRQV